MATSGERSGSGSVGSAAAAANVLTGFLSFTSTAASTTVLTVPAGRTWVGTVSVNVDAVQGAAGAAVAISAGFVSLTGAGVTPPAGNVFQVTARCGPNAAGGTVSAQSANTAAIPLTVIAPAGNSVALQMAVSITGSSGDVVITAAGALQ